VWHAVADVTGVAVQQQHVAERRPTGRRHPPAVQPLAVTAGEHQLVESHARLGQQLPRREVEQRIQQRPEHSTQSERRRRVIVVSTAARSSRYASRCPQEQG
jgi:short subunit dehydrogenase-like uncharacterized protein